ncbi:MAG: DUF4159 domain-containing protein [Alphaproteobacteria bacterium]|nr:DUF4159 domain-containing protein [Alphaproteobacteria bacterium]
MRRRDLLLGVGAGLLLPRLGRALGDASKVDVVEITLPAGTTSRPEAWIRMLYELDQITSIETVNRVVQVGPEDPKLFDHPFAALVGDGAFPPLPEPAVEQLRRYITYGGFLFIDDTTGGRRSAFDDSVRRLCTRLFPTKPLYPLPADHSLYRSFFLLQRPVGRLDTFDHIEGISLGEITPVMYFRNDLSGALARGPDGRPLFAVVPGGDRQRGEAIKLSVNLMLYALTSNYKKDQAHVKQLIEEGRLDQGGRP